MPLLEISPISQWRGCFSISSKPLWAWISLSCTGKGTSQNSEEFIPADPWCLPTLVLCCHSCAPGWMLARHCGLELTTERCQSSRTAQITVHSRAWDGTVNWCFEILKQSWIIENKCKFSETFIQEVNLTFTNEHLWKKRWWERGYCSWKFFCALPSPQTIRAK